MSVITRFRLGLVLSLAALATLAGSPLAAAEPPTLRNLSGLNEVRDAFNADAGKPRLVLLLSPT